MNRIAFVLGAITLSIGGAWLLTSRLSQDAYALLTGVCVGAFAVFLPVGAIAVIVVSIVIDRQPKAQTPQIINYPKPALPAPQEQPWKIERREELIVVERK